MRIIRLTGWVSVWYKPSITKGIRVKKLTTVHKIKHHIKARVNAHATKKSAKKSLHQEHADNLYKMAHPTDAKRQKSLRRTLTHLVLPIGLIVATASFAIGAEVASNSNTAQSAPTVPPNSFCRIFSDTSGGLASQDSRIGMTLDDNQYPNKVTINTAGYTRNYVYASDGQGNYFSEADVTNNVLQSYGISFGYIKICATNNSTEYLPFNTRASMVDQQYRDFFGRAATAGEQSWWAASGWSSQQIVGWAVNQEADQRGSMVRLYKAYFKRWPDAGGYAYWIGLMKNGMRLNQISDYFSTSAEFNSTYGSLSNAQFVTLVYKNVLFRQPDTGGYNYWVGRLNNRSITRGSMMLEFSESSENKATYIKTADIVGVSLRMLKRAPSDSEIYTWVANNYTANSVAFPLIFNSSEYANRIVK